MTSVTRLSLCCHVWGFFSCVVSGISHWEAHLTSVSTCLVTSTSMCPCAFIFGLMGLLENSGGPSEHIIPTETGRRWNSFLIHSWSDQWLLSPLSSSFVLTIPLVGFLCFLLFLCRVFLSQSYNHTPPFRHSPPPLFVLLFSH